ncbi:hypothetical protein [Actinoplanes rectilineatus]|uniref:hypothetical protein n=1 Tax=Actinoplanes rectilineatus TaxID=113571 RepID=UPI0005F2DD4D|nr:hypothetical protein [Actinoplanes rectilineatus]
MTPTPPGNTGRTTDDTKAAAFFTGALTLAAGGAGLLVAGLVLGFDWMLRGEPADREHLASRRRADARDRYNDSFAWLENDRAEQAAYRRARRDWFNADPETRGNSPTSSETFGHVMARLWHRSVVGANRFRKGWAHGRESAELRRADGDPNWWKPNLNPHRIPNDPYPTGSMPDDPEPQPTPTPAPDPSAVIDAEIVPDVPQPGPRDVVVVGADTDPQAHSGDAARNQALDNLAAEVNGSRPTGPADPSPPLTVIR